MRKQIATSANELQETVMLINVISCPLQCEYFGLPLLRQSEASSPGLSSFDRFCTCYWSPVASLKTFVLSNEDKRATKHAGGQHIHSKAAH